MRGNNVELRVGARARFIAASSSRYFAEARLIKRAGDLYKSGVCVDWKYVCAGRYSIARERYPRY